jgi:hypothetical protein
MVESKVVMTLVDSADELLLGSIAEVSVEASVEVTTNSVDAMLLVSLVGSVVDTLDDSTGDPVAEELPGSVEVTVLDSPTISVDELDTEELMDTVVGSLVLILVSVVSAAAVLVELLPISVETSVEETLVDVIGSVLLTVAVEPVVLIVTVSVDVVVISDEQEPGTITVSMVIAGVQTDGMN